MKLRYRLLKDIPGICCAGDVAELDAATMSGSLGHRLDRDDVRALLTKHPEALQLIYPEARPAARKGRPRLVEDVEDRRDAG